MDSPEDRVVIGWDEYVDLPEWGILNLRAKVDTGARTSAIHVENVEEVSGHRVRFDVVLHRKKRNRRVRVSARVVRRARVRSSTGHFSTRLFVATKMVLAGVEREIELSLVDREKMIFRMLLGRSALRSPFLIDLSHRIGRPSSRKKKKKTTKKKKKKKTSGEAHRPLKRRQLPRE